MFDVGSFKISTNDHIIDVQQFDDIDFVCPYYSTVTSSDGHRQRHRHHEYYVIYRVRNNLLATVLSCLWFPALRFCSSVTISVTASVLPFNSAVTVTVSAPCKHHGYINDGNHFTFLCSKSPVQLVRNGRVELSIARLAQGLAVEFPALLSGRSSRPGITTGTEKIERDPI